MIKLRRVYIGALFFNLLFYVSLFLNYSSIVYGEISLLTTLIVIYECQMQRILKLCNAKKKSECDNKFLNIIEIFPLVMTAGNMSTYLTMCQNAVYQLFLQDIVKSRYFIYH